MYKTTHSQWAFKPKALPIALELAPFAIQAAVIAMFVTAAHPALLESIGATIISLIWLRVSQSKLPDQYAELCERRQLFTQLGEWLGHKDAGRAVDRIQAECITEEGDSVYSENIQATVTAAGIEGLARGVVSASLYVYLAILALPW